MQSFPPYERDDDLILRARQSGRPQVRVRRSNEVAVVIGRGGKPADELHEEAIAAEGVPIYRRPGGGCSVVLDPGNAVTSVVLPLDGISRIRSTFDAVSSAVVEALASAGLPGVSVQGVSDLVFAGRKIGGSSVYRTRGIFYYATTLLLDPDTALMTRYLKHPPREPDYRAGRSHEDFVGSMRELSGGELDGDFLAAVEERLEAELSKPEGRFLVVR